MNPTQCRMARAAIGLSIAEFAKLANVSTNTVVRFEGDEELKAATVEQMTLAFLQQGVIFEYDDKKGSGVFYMGRRVR
jgi:DNA-binding transcriptional regulator YiaG